MKMAGRIVWTIFLVRSQAKLTWAAALISQSSKDAKMYVSK